MKTDKITILIIEDDLLSRLALRSRLERYGIILEAKDSDEAHEIIKNKDKAIDFAFVDLDLEKELLGLEIIKTLTSLNIYNIVLSAREEEDVVLKAYQAGCKDFLSKPYNKLSIEKVVQKFFNFRDKEKISRHLKEKFVTCQANFIAQLEIIEDAIFSSAPILIRGETGTGKTFLAKHIHELANDCEKPFIHLNCAEISESLVESELFGHEKGAFTGAIKSKKGLLELANNGTLFLDEIATLPLVTQMKLLKAIEEKTFYPVGSEKMVSSNFRLISATCENLDLKVQKGEFRADFLFRLKGFNLYLNPLRERKKDISLLIDFFLKKNQRKIVLTKNAKELMLNYKWPGNLRELEKIVEIISTNGKGIVEANDLRNLIKEEPIDELSNIDIEFVKSIGLNAYLEKIEAMVVERALLENGDKVRKTLTDLKISNNSFYRIMTNVKSRVKSHAQ